MQSFVKILVLLSLVSSFCVGCTGFVNAAKFGEESSLAPTITPTPTPTPTYSLKFTTQPSSTGTVGSNFGTQPIVSLVDDSSVVQSGIWSQVTLTPYTDSTCQTAATGSLTNGTAIIMGNGVATFSGLNHSSAETIYLKASDGTHTSDCSTAIAVADLMMLKLDAEFANSGTAAYTSGTCLRPTGASGRPWADLSGNANNGSIQNTTFACNDLRDWNGDGTAAGSGQAGPYRFAFDNYSYMNLTNLITLSGDFSIEGWVYFDTTSTNPDGGGSNVVTGYYDGSTVSMMWNFYLNIPRLYVSGVGDVAVGTTSMTAQAWTHYVFVRKGNIFTVYQNGLDDTSSIMTWTGDFKINSVGRSATSWTLGGALNYLTVYNRALTATEVSAHCNARAAKFPSVTCH